MLCINIYHKDEQWKQIIHNNILTNYEISNFGNVRNKYTKEYKNPRFDKYGYLRVTLYISPKKVTYSIHKLVATHFIQNHFNKPTVNHKDCNKLNNFFENLEWSTNKEQIIHAYKNNLIQLNYGENHINNKYPESLIHSICFLLENNETIDNICKILNVKKSLVMSVKSKKTWIKISNQYKIPRVREQKICSKKLKNEISRLILEGFTTKQIILYLKLSNTKAIKNVIMRLKTKLKEEGSTTIEDYYVIDIT